MSVAAAPPVEAPAAPSQQSLIALGWLNFFLAGMQTAFGPIVAAYLVVQEWSAKDIGVVLSIGGFASLVAQVPGGELLDAVRAKRLLVATGVLIVAFSALLFWLWPTFRMVAAAEVLQGITSGILGPGVVAITLGLVGHAKLAERLGLNQRFAAAGGIVVTVTMALIAYAESPWAMLVPVALAVPVLVALHRIRSEDIDVRRASGAEYPVPTIPSEPGAMSLCCRTAGC
jgi:MFS family permease